MHPGSIAEWFGAIATTLAAVVALYFGLRDQRRVERCQASRQQLHDYADELLLQVERVRVGRYLERRKFDTTHLRDDVEASRLYAYIDDLGPVRRWRAMRTLRRIYSEKSIEEARLNQSHDNPGNAVDSVILDASTFGDDVRLRQRALRHTAMIEEGSPVELPQLERLFRRLTRI